MFCSSTGFGVMLLGNNGKSDKVVTNCRGVWVHLVGTALVSTKEKECCLSSEHTCVDCSKAKKVRGNIPNTKGKSLICWLLQQSLDEIGELSDESLAMHKTLELEIGVLESSVDNTAKTRRPQPRSNTMNDRVPSASKSKGVCIKNKEVEVEDHHRKFTAFSKNKKHMSSECEAKAFIQFLSGSFLGTVSALDIVHVAAILDLEVAFRRNTCFVRNLEGVDLLKGTRSTNLYTINLMKLASASHKFASWPSSNFYKSSVLASKFIPPQFWTPINGP
ncbi:hypothetical protein Tco_0635600 [Tanacetum coccineum]